MLLRNSISNTKRFFRKTLHSFKSLFSGSDYQRIPKTTPYRAYSYPVGVDMNIQPSYKDLDRFDTDFSDPGESADMEKGKNKRSNKNSSPLKQDNEVLNGSFMKFAKPSPVKNNNHQIERRETQQYLKPKRVHDKTRQEDSCSKAGTRKERSCLLAEKLKELELIDMTNVDHVLDLEEFLHYYSRLTCAAYVDIADKFFMEMYAEFFCQSATPARICSRPKLRS